MNDGKCNFNGGYTLGKNSGTPSEIDIEASELGKSGRAMVAPLSNGLEGFQLYSTTIGNLEDDYHDDYGGNPGDIHNAGYKDTDYPDQGENTDNDSYDHNNSTTSSQTKADSTKLDDSFDDEHNYSSGVTEVPQMDDYEYNSNYGGNSGRTQVGSWRLMWQQCLRLQLRAR